METLCAGVHYPTSTGEFAAWFRTDADCLDYLEWLRWPRGFVCPDCGHVSGWRLGDGRFRCVGCLGRTSTTAGTIFNRTRTPLTVWFAICWQFAIQKNGVSGWRSARTRRHGRCCTGLRSVLVRPGREAKHELIEVAGQVRLIGRTLVGAQQPPLGP